MRLIEGRSNKTFQPLLVLTSTRVLACENIFSSNLKKFIEEFPRSSQQVFYTDFNILNYSSLSTSLFIIFVSPS